MGLFLPWEEDGAPEGLLLFLRGCLRHSLQLGGDAGGGEGKRLGEEDMKQLRDPSWDAA